jgi:K+-sensing histidine kinase KdpD
MNAQTALEINRINELVQLEILDTPKEREFDDIVELASKLCNTPISLISLVDVNRQWFKAKKGLDVSETDRSASFCTHALNQDDLLVVNDATLDERFVSNPLVTSDPHIRFYAGAPILSPKGYKLGTLCIIDREPKELSWQQASTLKMLSLQVAKLIELHYKKIQLNAAEEELALQKLRNQKVLNQKHYITGLCQLENIAVQTFIATTLAPLKSGKFTKKELSDIYTLSQQQAEQLSLFNEALRTVCDWQGQQKDHLLSPAPIMALVDEVLQALYTTIKEQGHKIVTYIPETLSLHLCSDAVSLILKTLLQAIVRFVKKKEIQLVAMEQGKGIELRFSLTDADVRYLFDHYFRLQPETALTNGEQQLLHLELALIKELVVQLRGKIEWSQLGNTGSAIVLYLPNAGS